MRSREFQICSARQVEHLLRILEALSFWYARFYWFVKCLTIFLPSSKFVTLYPPQGIFALQKSLRVGCDGGRGSSSQSRQPPRKEISRGNLLCAESGLTNLSYPRLQSVQKYVGTPNRYNRPYRAARGARGAAAPLFGKESRGNPFKGFLWAISSRRLDTALLCAAKKRGVELNQLEGLCLKYSGYTWPRQNARRGSQGHQSLLYKLLKAH